MKREIKFRAWDSELHFMHNGSRFIVIEWHPDGTFHSERLLLQQFTGLYDTSGNEIFEGDIVEVKKKSGFGTGNGDKKVIVWDTAHLCFIMVWLQYFQPDVEYRNGNPITKTIGGYTYDKVTDSKKVEVIGNIYENQELLNK